MTITPLAFLNDGVPLATDEDLKKEHPRIVNDLWQGETSYVDQLSKAWDLLSIDLKKKGYDPTLVSNSTANIAWAKEAVIQKAFAIIFRDFFDESGDKWHLLMEAHAAEYQSYIDAETIDYDLDEDGTVSDDEEGIHIVTRFSR